MSETVSNMRARAALIEKTNHTTLVSSQKIQRASPKFSLVRDCTKWSHFDITVRRGPVAAYFIFLSVRHKFGRKMSLFRRLTIFSRSFVDDYCVAWDKFDCFIHRLIAVAWSNVLVCAWRLFSVGCLQNLRMNLTLCVFWTSLYWIKFTK